MGLFKGVSSLVKVGETLKGKREYKIIKHVNIGATNIYLSKNGYALKQFKDYTVDNPSFKEFFDFHQKVQNTIKNLYGVLSADEVFECGGYCFLSRKYINDIVDIETLALSYVDLDVKKNVAKEIIKIIKGIHDKDIVYTDLKPEQFVLTKKGEILLIDFDFAVSSTYGFNRAGGTKEWYSPEHIKKSPLDKSSDIFTLGEIINFLFTKKHPFEKHFEGDFENAVITGDFDVNEFEYANLVRKMLSPDKNLRPSIDEVYAVFNNGLDSRKIYLKYKDKKTIVISDEIITRDFCKQIFEEYKSVAPKQFLILKKTDGWYVKPFEINISKFEQTKLNGEILKTETKLQKGDVLSVGNLHIEIS